MATLPLKHPPEIGLATNKLGSKMRTSPLLDLNAPSHVVKTAVSHPISCYCHNNFVPFVLSCSSLSSTFSLCCLLGAWYKGTKERSGKRQGHRKREERLLMLPQPWFLKRGFIFLLVFLPFA